MIQTFGQRLQPEPTTAVGPTLRDVLVPLDGSELAEQALSVGAAHARRTGATLHLVSVHEPMPRAAMPPDYPMPVLELESEAGKGTLARLRFALAPQPETAQPSTTSLRQRPLT